MERAKLMALLSAVVTKPARAFPQWQQREKAFTLERVKRVLKKGYMPTDKRLQYVSNSNQSNRGNLSDIDILGIVSKITADSIEYANKTTDHLFAGAKAVLVSNVTYSDNTAIAIEAEEDSAKDQNITQKTVHKMWSNYSGEDQNDAQRVVDEMWSRIKSDKAHPADSTHEQAI